MGLSVFTRKGLTVPAMSTRNGDFSYRDKTGLQGILLGRNMSLCGNRSAIVGYQKLNSYNAYTIRMRNGISRPA